MVTSPVTAIIDARSNTPSRVASTTKSAPTCSSDVEAGSVWPFTVWVRVDATDASREALTVISPEVLTKPDTTASLLAVMFNVATSIISVS